MDLVKTEDVTDRGRRSESWSSPSAAALWFSCMSLAEPAVESTMCLLKETKTTSQSSPAYQRGSLVGSGREMWLHISNTISGGRLSFPFADSIISVWGGGAERGHTSAACRARLKSVWPSWVIHAGSLAGQTRRLTLIHTHGPCAHTWTHGQPVIQVGPDWKIICCWSWEIIGIIPTGVIEGKTEMIYTVFFTLEQIRIYCKTHLKYTSGSFQFTNKLQRQCHIAKQQLI